jgi:hypothetical protein
MILTTSFFLLATVNCTIICFKIKNPPTVHSTWKIQPTTSPTFVFSVLQVSAKSRVMKENCCTVVLVVVLSVFYYHFIILLKKYDMVATTFLYIIIIFCYVNKLNSSMSNLGGRLSQPKKSKLLLGISFFCQHNSIQVVDFWLWNRLYYFNGVSSWSGPITRKKITNIFQLFYCQQISVIVDHAVHLTFEYFLTSINVSGVHLNFRSKLALKSQLWTHQPFKSYLSFCFVCVFTRVVRSQSILQRQL